MSELSRELGLATQLALDAGKIFRAELHRQGGPRGGAGKAPADEEAEAMLRQRLEVEFPDHGIRGEELFHQNRVAGDEQQSVWLLDPNDGTSAFLKGRRGAAVSIAMVRRGRPVLGVVYAYGAPDDAGDLFTWAQGESLRRNGAVIHRVWAEALNASHTLMVSQDADRNSAGNSAACAPARFRALPSIAYRLALVAAGEAEAGVSLNAPGDWDYAAGHALVRGAGGELYNERGEVVTYAADGASRVGMCFGGGPLARELARRDWSAVLAKPGASEDPYPLVNVAKGQLVNDPAALSRAQGCLLGQLAGDSLGGLVEFQRGMEIRLRHPRGLRQLEDGGVWGILAGQPTDDSEMALALARSIVRESRYVAESAREAYKYWMNSRPFDMGNTVRRGLAGDPNATSQANGALMRLSPLAIFGAALPDEAMMTLARADAKLTHPNPVCGDASAAFAMAVAHAIRTSATPQETYAFACERATSYGLHPDVREALAAARDGGPKDYESQMGWVLVAFQNAFHQLLTTPSIEDALAATIAQGGDTDTNAAIAGALLGAVHGRGAIPWQWRDRVLTCRPLAGTPTRHVRPRAFWGVDALELSERLLFLGRQFAA